MSLSTSMKALQRLTDHPGLWISLTVGLALKLLIAFSGKTTFGSDEAILGLMARHILVGERPIFYYGQLYMGALDAYLIAGVSLLVGMGVYTIRIVQITLYLSVLISTYMLAIEVSHSKLVASISTFLIAIPTVTFGTYTTLSLGNYVEILLLNNLILIIGLRVIINPGAGWKTWLALGIVAGLGWWSMALVVTVVAPLLLIALLIHRSALPYKQLGVLLTGFIAGSSPWLFALFSDSSGIFIDLTRIGSTQSLGVPVSAIDKIVAFFFLILPSHFGLRDPWEVGYRLLGLGIPVLLVSVVILIQGLGDMIRADSETVRHFAQVVGGGWLLLSFILLLTDFGLDPTARYLLPLYPLSAVVAGWWIALRVNNGQRLQGGVVFALLIGFNLITNLDVLLQDPIGYTTQFTESSHIPDDHDPDLIAFLNAIGVQRGYTTYWVAYRISFLSDEEIILVPSLPSRDDLRLNPAEDRYPAYNPIVESADEIAYITAVNPDLDVALQHRLTEMGADHLLREIGPYTVYYGFSNRVSPDDIGLFAPLIDGNR